MYYSGIIRKFTNQAIQQCSIVNSIILHRSNAKPKFLTHQRFLFPALLVQPHQIVLRKTPKTSPTLSQSDSTQKAREMPELPEVEAARRAVQENCVGKRITKAIIADDPKVIDGVSRADFEASLLGKTIVSAHRKGKNMWLRLDSPPFPSFQFGAVSTLSLSHYYDNVVYIENHSVW